VLQGAAGEGGGVEEALQDLGGLGGVEAGGAVLAAAGDRAGDGAGAEGLGAALGDHRVDAPGDRVPHQLRHPRRDPERVQHRDRPRFWS